MSQPSATAEACANIAFVKYWGNADPHLRLPYNDSLSMNLGAARTVTTVAFGDAPGDDTVVVEGVEWSGPARERVVEHLDRIRALAGLEVAAVVESANTFPMGTGIASSASGFAALTVAGAAAAGLGLGERELSALARRGSGSAARSIPDGFAYWASGARDEDSFAVSFAPAEHWALRDVVAVVSRRHKTVGSSGGHDLAVTSPLFPQRLLHLPGRIAAAKQAILDRDLATLGPLVESEALCLHAVALTSAPPILYWTAETVALLGKTTEWREAGLEVYYTLDAGPNVHLICEEAHAAEVAAQLERLEYVDLVLVNGPAGPARLITGA